MHEDKDKIEEDKQKFFKVRRWVIENNLDLEVIKEQENDILKLRDEMKADKLRYKHLNQECKYHYFHSRTAKFNNKVVRANICNYEEHLEQILNLQKKEDEEKVRNKILKDIVKKKEE